jgi:MFS family permease
MTLPPAGVGGLRRLQWLVAAVLFVDTAFFSAVTPLLPYDVHRLGVPAAQAGLVVAGYAIGTLAAALPSGMLVARFGVRSTVIAGVLLTGGATIGFGFAGSLPALLVARVAEGVGGTCSWTAVLAWLAAAAPVSRRGTVLGRAYGAASVGSLVGPAVGGLAGVFGPARIFSVAGVTAAALAFAALSMPAPAPQGGLSLRAALPGMKDPRLLAGLALSGVAGLTLGTLAALAPLRLAATGAGPALIAAAFLVAAGGQGLSSAWIGRRADRSGRRRPLRWALLGGLGCGLLFVFPLDRSALVLAVLLSAAAFGSLFAPSTALAADGADRRGLPQGMVAALLNLLWALGSTAGAASSTELAALVAPWLPWLLVAAVCLLAWLALGRREAGPPGLVGPRPPPSASAATRV